MLIGKKIALQVGDTAVLRLVTGEEVIGRIVALADYSITVTKPIVLAMNMLPNGQAGIQFMPFMVGAEEDGHYAIEFAKLVAHPMKARKDVADNYLAATTSIVPAAASSLLKP